MTSIQLRIPPGDVTPPRSPFLDSVSGHELSPKIEGNASKLSLPSPRQRIPSQISLPPSITKTTLDRILKMLQSAYGLDKIIRTIQYTVRLLSHILLVKGLHTPKTSAATLSIRRQFGLTRKLLRAFNNVAQFDAAARLLRSFPRTIRQVTIIDLVNFVEVVGYTGFGVMDTLGYLPDAGISNIPYKSTVDKLTFHFWLYALAASIVGGAGRIYGTRNKILEHRAAQSLHSEPPKLETSDTGDAVQVWNDTKTVPPTPPDSPLSKATLVLQPVRIEDDSEVADLRKAQYEMTLKVVGSLADINFPLAALQFSGFSSLSDGVLGFAGCISSAIGLRKAWNSTASTDGSL